MKYYIFDSKIESEPISKLVEFINNTPDNITIVFSSSGGHPALGRVATFILNNNKNRITLIAVNEISSAAFDIFYTFKGLKHLTKGCLGMYHFSSINVPFSANGKPENDGKATLEKATSDKNDTIKIAKIIMTPKEFTQFKNNQCVFFPFSRMKQIFNTAKII